MKKALLLIGALVLVSFFACGNGCILHTREITIVVTDYVCTGFDENHDDENYMDETVSFDDTFWEDLDAILAENELTKDDIEGANVAGVYYQVITGPTPPPAGFTEWTVSGRIWVELDGGGPVLIATYQSVGLSAPMAAPMRITTVQTGLDVLDAAMVQYLTADDPDDYPDLVFYADRETGDINPSPSEAFPFVMTWDGCLSMRIDFIEKWDVYDMFPAD
jgi:hypothetical protein